MRKQSASQGASTAPPIPASFTSFSSTKIAPKPIITFLALFFFHRDPKQPQRDLDSTTGVTYIKQQGILINRQFPGPQIDSVTNDNVIERDTAEKEFMAGWTSSTSLPLLFIELPEASATSPSPTALGLRSHSHHPTEISPFSPVTGSRKTDGDFTILAGDEDFTILSYINHHLPLL
ncbi:unnamed protein product [Lactuca saligna]|uniref:Uncharacterized protein n=1 Tax=Lactuca saligna TaxID=75948 RepID=A0AA36EJ22_LACSI|nr:unnamed protein product [Lactuca saligna]